MLMKKWLAVLLVFAMCFGLCACGENGATPTDQAVSDSSQKATKEELLSMATGLTDAQLSGAQSNDAMALSLVEKVYKATGEVQSIGTDFCEVAMQAEDSKTYFQSLLFRVYLPLEELARLQTGDTISIVGKIDHFGTEEASVNGTTYAKKFYEMKDVYSIDPFENVSLQSMIEAFGQDSANEYFRHYRKSYEAITNETFLSVFGEVVWNATYYMQPDKDITAQFRKDGTVAYTEDGSAAVWDWQFAGDALCFSNREYDARKIDDNTIVLYFTEGYNKPHWLFTK